MRVLQVTDDLTLEIHGDDRPLVRLRSQAMERDRDGECAGTVVVYDEELDALVSALLEARRLLRRQPPAASR